MTQGLNLSGNSLSLLAYGDSLALASREPPPSSAAEAAVEDFGPRTARRSEPPRARSRAPRFEEGPAKLPSESPRVDDTSATRGPRPGRGPMIYYEG